MSSPPTLPRQQRRELIRPLVFHIHPIFSWSAYHCLGCRLVHRLRRASKLGPLVCADGFVSVFRPNVLLWLERTEEDSGKSLFILFCMCDDLSTYRHNILDCQSLWFADLLARCEGRGIPILLLCGMSKEALVPCAKALHDRQCG